MGIVFGECAILNDGRLVIAPWDAAGLWVGANFMVGPHLRLPDACLTAGGRVWAVGAIQTGGVQVWSQQTGWLALPFSGPFGTRTIIRADGEGCRVAVATSATTWTCVAVSQVGIVTTLSTGPVPNGGGGAGMKNWDSAGAPRSCAPIDSTVSGHPVRLAITEGPVTIACGLGDLPDQLVLSKMGPLGTLHLCAPEWATLRLSANGQWWVVTQFGTSPTVFSGAIPATVPPLITNTEPPVPPSLPAKATIDSFETPITVGATSRAVAKVTQGTPDRFRWQWFNGIDWKLAADNPATDLDHHYQFSSIGRYPIRLQTVVNGEVTDTSSSTSRIVEVKAGVPIPIPPGPEPPVPGPGQVVVHVTDVKTHAPIALADTWSQVTPSVVVKTDLNGYALITANTSGVCTKKDGYHSPGEPQHQETCKVLAPLVELELDPIPPPAPPVPNIYAAGKIFRDAANAPWRYKGVSGFKLGNIFETGGDIRPFLDAYRGFNVIRVWAYTDWAGTGWARPSSVTAVQDFLAFVANYSGHLVEYTYVTNDSAEAHDWASGFVQQLYAGPRPRMFNEIRNEPQTHSQTISTKRCKPAFDASGAVYASGNYEHSENAFGSYLVAHPMRDSEWVRRCHDLLEYFQGHGPHNTSEPAHKVPCVGDETPKPQDVAPPKAPLTKADDWRAYFGGCALLGAGATFHSETGKWGLPPTAEEAALAAAALEGLDAFPADAPLGNYSRPSDSSLRTYIVGNYSVRIRPTTDKHPVSGFTRIGASNILWRR